MCYTWRYDKTSGPLLLEHLLHLGRAAAWQWRRQATMADTSRGSHGGAVTPVVRLRCAAWQAPRQSMQSCWLQHLQLRHLKLRGPLPLRHLLHLWHELSPSMHPARPYHGETSCLVSWQPRWSLRVWCGRCIACLGQAARRKAACGDITSVVLGAGGGVDHHLPILRCWL